MASDRSLKPHKIPGPVKTLRKYHKEDVMFSHIYHESTSSTSTKFRTADLHDS